MKAKVILDKQRSLDIKNFDLGFVRGLNLEDGAATITSTQQIYYVIFSIFSRRSKKFNKIILCGGGRKKNLFSYKIKEN